MKPDLDALAAAGDRERIRLASAWRSLEHATGRLSSETAARIETAGSTLKWGGISMLAATVLLRWTKVRTGWKVGKVLLGVAPALARLAAPRAPGFLSHLLRRRDSEKR